MDGGARPPSHGGLTDPDPARSPQEPLAGSLGTQTPTPPPAWLQGAPKALQEGYRRMMERGGAPDDGPVALTTVEQTLEDAVAMVRSILPVREVYTEGLAVT